MGVTVGHAISLECACDFVECSEFAFPLFKQLDSGDYDVCSVMPIPANVEDWRFEHKTARKRADRCQRRGYTFVHVRPEERADELFAINTSADWRQGRPMSDGYRRRLAPTPDPVYPCLRHCVRRYGVEDATGTLVAYLWLYRCGQLALVSQILGDARHLENEVMFLLFQGVVESETSDPDGCFVYNRADSGTDGLKWFKERLGFVPAQVRWTV